MWGVQPTARQIAKNKCRQKTKCRQEKILTESKSLNPSSMADAQVQALLFCSVAL
jgi:hypothetical protein